MEFLTNFGSKSTKGSSLRRATEAGLSKPILNSESCGKPASQWNRQQERNVRFTPAEKLTCFLGLYELCRSKCTAALSAFL
jgi:hypothetical protein